MSKEIEIYFIETSSPSEELESYFIERLVGKSYKEVT